MSGERLHHEVLIAGFGGQGVVLAGLLLANAALAEGREVVWAPSYGPEMRGGPVHCTVIVASERIGSPEVSLADSLLIMDRASLDRFAKRVKPGGLFVLNSSLVEAGPDNDTCKMLPVPALDAAENLGNRQVANVVMLGAFLERRPIVSPESVRGAMRVLAGRGYENLIGVNERALARGQELARESCGDGE
ncbi:MAG: 2-oxoacid:acceptor oxidoreductase family protein [Armatimonadota bacterium]|nr:MAG: 2-oxoacid:acceptor oxidoreductase family protein [Armatimonadota bacterium]